MTQRDGASGDCAGGDGTVDDGASAGTHTENATAEADGGTRTVDGGVVGTDEPSLVVVCGPPGVGKTTVAGAAATHLDATVLRTDVVRKELFPEPTYADGETAAVYEELLDRGRELVTAGGSVVLDGTFRTVALRRRAVSAARECGAQPRVFRVVCGEAVVRERLAARETDASDADFEIHRQIRREFEPVDRDHHRIDNSGAASDTHRQVETALDTVHPGQVDG
ncbi:MAG: putative kinase [halophilic archaeon J07HB67]|nr:MAG: putative kinase [halophilic archaeon J07HB67]